MATTIERTPFGERLHQARLHAKLSQRELAERVGLKSQATLSQLEISGQGSSRTVLIAEICGVRAKWLADGEGPMLEPPAEVPPKARQVASEGVMHHLVGKPAAADYRTIALSLAAALEDSGTDLTVKQFIKLLEATYENLKPT